MENAPILILTNRCLLRPATPEDYDALIAAIGSPSFPQELPLPDLYRQGKLKAWFDSMLTMSKEGKACVLSIDLQSGERCIGQVSLVRRGTSASWNLAFWLHSSHWGAGVAAEAAQAMIRHAFTVMMVDEVWAGAALWNRRSIRTLDKLGLQPVESAQLDSDLIGLHICAISRSEWLLDGGEAGRGLAG
jgi:RimJ/RimL family protein N-acetyltransferase